MSFAFSQIEPETTGQVDRIPTPVSSYLNESWQQGWHDSAFASIMRMREYSLENGDDGSKMLDPEEASIKYGISHHLSFDEPVRESVARLMNQRKQEEIDRQFVLDNGSSMARTIPGLAANFIGGISNPLDFGAMFIPFVGEEKLATQAALKGRGVVRQAIALGMFGVESLERASIPVPRFTASMIQGALYQSAAEIPTFLEAKQTGDEYTLNRFLVDVGAGGALAGLFHMALAGAARLFEGLKPETRQAMSRQAMNDFVKDEETDLTKYVNVDENAIMQRVLMENEPLLRAQAERQVPIKGVQRTIYEQFKDGLPVTEELTPEEQAVFNRVKEKSNSDKFAMNAAMSFRRGKARADFLESSQGQELVKQERERQIDAVMDQLRKDHDPSQKFTQARQREIERQLATGRVLTPAEVEQHQHAAVPDSAEIARVQSEVEDLRKDLNINPSFFDRESEFAGLGRKSTVPTVEDVRRSRKLDQKQRIKEAINKINSQKELPKVYEFDIMGGEPEDVNHFMQMVKRHGGEPHLLAEEGPGGGNPATMAVFKNQESADKFFAEYGGQHDAIRFSDDKGNLLPTEPNENERPTDDILAGAKSSKEWSGEYGKNKQKLYRDLVKEYGITEDWKLSKEERINNVLESIELEKVPEEKSKAVDTALGCIMDNINPS